MVAVDDRAILGGHELAERVRRRRQNQPDADINSANVRFISVLLHHEGVYSRLLDTMTPAGAFDDANRLLCGTMCEDV